MSRGLSFLTDLTTKPGWRWAKSFPTAADLKDGFWQKVSTDPVAPDDVIEIRGPYADEATALLSKADWTDADNVRIGDQVMQWDAAQDRLEDADGWGVSGTTAELDAYAATQAEVDNETKFLDTTDDKIYRYLSTTAGDKREVSAGTTLPNASNNADWTQDTALLSDRAVTTAEMDRRDLLQLNKADEATPGDITAGTDKKWVDAQDIKTVNDAVAALNWVASVVHDAAGQKLIVTDRAAVATDILFPIIDDLLSTDINVPLSANQGRVIRLLIEGIGERITVDTPALMAADAGPEGQSYFVLDDDGLAAGNWAMYIRTSTGPNVDTLTLSKADITGAFVVLDPLQIQNRADVNVGLVTGKLISDREQFLKGTVANFDSADPEHQIAKDWDAETLLKANDGLTPGDDGVITERRRNYYFLDETPNATLPTATKGSWYEVGVYADNVADYDPLSPPPVVITRSVAVEDPANPGNFEWSIQGESSKGGDTIHIFNASERLETVYFTLNDRRDAFKNTRRARFALTVDELENGNADWTTDHANAQRGYTHRLVSAVNLAGATYNYRIHWKRVQGEYEFEVTENHAGRWNQFGAVSGIVFKYAATDPVKPTWTNLTDYPLGSVVLGKAPAGVTETEGSWYIGEAQSIRPNTVTDLDAAEWANWTWTELVPTKQDIVKALQTELPDPATVLVGSTGAVTNDGSRNGIYTAVGAAPGSPATSWKPPEHDHEVLENIQVHVRSGGTNAGSAVQLTFTDLDGNDYPPTDWTVSTMPGGLQSYAGATVATYDNAPYTGSVGIGHNKDGFLLFKYVGSTPNGISAVTYTGTNGANSNGQIIVNFADTNDNVTFANKAAVTDTFWTTEETVTTSSMRVLAKTDGQEPEYSTALNKYNDGDTVDVSNMPDNMLVQLSVAGGGTLTVDGTDYIFKGTGTAGENDEVIAFEKVANVIAPLNNKGGGTVISLDDTPANYTDGQVGDTLVLNAARDGFEFSDPPQVGNSVERAIYQRNRGSTMTFGDLNFWVPNSGNSSFQFRYLNGGTIAITEFLTWWSHQQGGASEESMSFALGSGFRYFRTQGLTLTQHNNYQEAMFKCNGWMYHVTVIVGGSWQNNRFTFTRWRLDGVKGDPGTDGAPGADGINGTDGTDGRGIVASHRSDGATAIGGTVYTLDHIIYEYTDGVFEDKGLLLAPVASPDVLLGSYDSTSFVTTRTFTLPDGRTWQNVLDEFQFVYFLVGGNNLFTHEQTRLIHVDDLTVANRDISLTSYQDHGTNAYHMKFRVPFANGTTITVDNDGSNMQVQRIKVMGIN